ncbi:MAG: ISAzo13 family transposase [Candidatus Solibacter usitatus]|nr:ISAzo13 family transposase [Candidatus Solibacter usitatus]
MDGLAGVRRRFGVLEPLLDEKSRRLLVAAESRVWGVGGISAVSRATGISRQVIRQGLRELEQAPTHPAGRIRRPGGGRKKAKQKDPTLVADLEKLVEPTTRGDPESCLRWTCKSVRKLAEELEQMGHQVSYPVVAELLHEMEYSLQANRKTKEGDSHPDRNAQFEHINAKVQQYIGCKQPVISVDTKKKELVGDFKNSGQDWRPKGKAAQVRVHDFVIPELGRAAPYGVYDLALNTGWVSVGVDHDTASFAVETIRRWWHAMGKEKYPQAKRLLITADGGGSNGSRLRLWKLELQMLADETGLAIAVSHFPPGTSKWNKIEHRLFSFISKNWRGQPLTSLKVIVSLIAGTTTRKGLRVHAEIDDGSYPAGIKVPDAEMAQINLRRDRFHGEWNYEIRPRR